MQHVFITGIGCVSAIGKNVQENLTALKAERSGISPLQLIESRHKDNLPVGEIKLTNQELNTIAGIHNSKSFSRSSLLGIVAAKEALQYADLHPDETCAFISSTTVAGMRETEQVFSKAGIEPPVLIPLDSHFAGRCTNEIASTLGNFSELTTISTACSSSANAIMLGARLIKSGRVKRALVGGTDALSRFTINGFNSLMILDSGWCKPFDKNRKGLNLGEGAAYLVLESEESLLERKAIPMGLVSGYANANDAHHQTASSPEGDGAFLTISGALQMAGLSVGTIDYINAHGTGTGNNDVSEYSAIARVFGAQIPDYSSTKMYTGHTLAAAGAIEAVFSLLSIKESCVWANLNWTDAMDEVSVLPTISLKNKTVKQVLSNSFGFGGNCTSIVLSQC